MIHDAGTDSHALFKSIDRLLKRKPDKRLPFCSSSVDLANRCAAFFKEKIDKPYSELTDVNVPDYFAALDTPTLSCNLEYFSPTTIHELSQIACHVGSKSCSLDPLPSALLVSQIDLLLPALYNIVDRSLETGHFPRSLKSADLSPLLKKPSLNHELLRNFRPISNLKVIMSKIIEKVVASRLIHYL